MRTLMRALALLLVSVGPVSAQDDREAGLFAEARQLPLVAQAVTVRILGSEATIDLDQSFANDGDAVAQADYVLHLPEEAVVTGFGFWRNGSLLEAELAERAAARAAHGAAASAGRATGLLETRGSVHRFSVYPIPPHGLQRVVTTLRLPVVTERGRSAVRLPLDHFLGQVAVLTTVVVHLETEEPLATFGADGHATRELGRGARWARFALSADEAVDLWWSEESEPLVTRADAVALDDGSFAVQLRVALNRAEGSESLADELVLLCDTSYSMRRRAAAIVDLVDRLRGQDRVPLRLVAVAEGWSELSAVDAAELVASLGTGTIGFRASWDDFLAAAEGVECAVPGRRCLAVTDPQLVGLPTNRSDLPATGFDLLFLADADELAFFDRVVTPLDLVVQPAIDPRARLAGLADELVRPLLVVREIRQRGGTFEVVGPARMRVAEGGLMRVPAQTRSTAPLELELSVGDRARVRSVPLVLLDPESRQGRAVRRAFMRSRLDEWTRAYEIGRDPDLRAQIVATSLREGIPTRFTALHVAEPVGGVVAEALPRTATPAPFLRAIGLLLLAGGGLVGWGRRR